MGGNKIMQQLEMDKIILGPFFFEVWLSLTSPGSFLVVTARCTLV